MPPKAEGPPGNTAFNVRFTHVTPEEAANGRAKKGTRPTVGLDAKARVSTIPTASLCLTDDQRAKVDAFYASNCLKSREFDLSKEQQQVAASELASLGLDSEALDDPACRWSACWSTKSTKGEHKQRVLYQW